MKLYLKKIGNEHNAYVYLLQQTSFGCANVQVFCWLFVLAITDYWLLNAMLTCLQLLSLWFCGSQSDFRETPDPRHHVATAFIKKF